MDHIGVIYWDAGKENGSYYFGSRVWLTIRVHVGIENAYLCQVGLRVGSIWNTVVGAQRVPMYPSVNYTPAWTLRASFRGPWAPLTPNPKPYITAVWAP